MNDASSIDLSRPAFQDSGLPPGAASTTPSSPWRVIDLRAVWSTVYRNRYIVIVALALCVLLGIAVTLLSTPIYKGTALIQIDLQTAQIIEGADIQPTGGGLQDTERYLETQVDVIESRSLARTVATQLGLFRNNTFLERMGVEPAAAPAGAFDLRQTRQEQVLDALQDNLEVELPVDSSVVSISFESPDRVLASQIANSFAENYITSNLRRKYDTTAYARQFLEDELANTRQRLEESDRALLEYARGAGLIDASGAGGNASSLTTANLGQFNSDVATATANRISAEQRWREAQGTPLMNLPSVLSNPAIQSLVQQRAQLRASYELNRERYAADYPVQQELQTQIDAFSRQINDLATDIRDGIRQEYDLSRRQETALRNELADIRGETLAEQDRGIRYNILRREVDTNRTLYEGLLQRYKEISAAAGISSNNISIVDRADPPVGPVRPRPLLNIALSIVAGLMLGLGLVFLRENFDDALRSTDDVETKLGLPAIGVIPKMKEDTDARAEMADRKSDLSEAYAALRSSLMLSTSTGAPKSLVFTSSGQGEGKSTSSLAIACSFAQLGRTVILIDADMRRPSQHKRFSVSNKEGLSGFLSSQNTLAQITHPTDQPGLDLITAGPIPVNPAELIAGPNMQELITQCENKYDLVVIDAPPVLGLADAPTLVSDVGSTIFVVEANRVHGRRANDALRRLRSGDAHILGVLLTKFDAKTIGYGAKEYGYVYDYGVKS